MDAEDWLKWVEKKLVITQCTDHEKVLFAAHQLFGTAANWWETYCNTHVNVDTITWNEFKARFRTHYVPRGTMKLKKKEFADLKQGGMTVNEYLNSFIQLSRYAPNDINTDEKKHDVFLNGLNDDIQFQLLNTDYADFQHLVDKAIVYENKKKETEKDVKRKVSSSGQSSRSNVRPRFSQPNQYFKLPQRNPATDASASAAPSVSDAATELSRPTSELPDVEASTTTTSTQRAATISPEHAARPPL
jgi:hypothetical protein